MLPPLELEVRAPLLPVARAACLYFDVRPGVWQPVTAAVSLVNTSTDASFIFHPMRQ